MPEKMTEQEFRKKMLDKMAQIPAKIRELPQEMQNKVYWSPTSLILMELKIAEKKKNGELK